MSEMTLAEGLAYFKRLLAMKEQEIEQLKRDIAVTEWKLKQLEQKQ